MLTKQQLFRNDADEVVSLEVATAAAKTKNEKRVRFRLKKNVDVEQRHAGEIKRNE